MMRTATFTIPGLLPALSLVIAPGTPAHAEQVGTASAVNAAATVNMRTITIGASINHMERIRTESTGSVQVLFVDKTSMTVGPNSDLTIDEYVYDPKAGSGTLVATLGKGAMRFVGGMISHNGNAEIKTSTASIGIRGGVAMFNGQNIYVGYGSSTVTSGGATVSLGAGEFTRTAGGGAPPTPPGPPPPGFVASQVQMFQSAGNQSGGTRPGTASSGNVASAERRATGSTNGAVAGSLTPQTPNATPAVQVNTVTSTLNQTIQTSVQSAAVPAIEGSKSDAKPTVTLYGAAGGIDQLTSGNQKYNSSIGGLATLALDAIANRLQANFTAFGNTTDTFQFGSLDPADTTPSTYTDYNTFSASSKKGGQFNNIGYAGEMSNLSRDGTRQLATSLGQPNLTICECEYTRWGFWNVHNTSNYSETVFGTWVVGRTAQVSDMPLTGTASYVGHVIANVATNTGDPRQAVGNFTNTVDFGARTGAVAVKGLDNTNYAGTVALQSNSVNFAGGLAGDVGNRAMAIVGGFVKGTTGPVGEMGGVVAITGNNYVGGGIFAAAVKR